eukprot:CAMPEP_0201718292 /NCGR_PEP_ID=MMETSP0593-20130828/3834_1 /ASSEMBLY_ACC=CAM_ASM_000672 /TAXON_ID=267983 /ORGANISM="Skeletonema japonicum, Strain CCMP2506" /LENGTH=515 /DNA_ID=CAMNT_0048208555 /DNA_START=180 /DNA_END=1727 /DNA_ORIENTATION=+
MLIPEPVEAALNFSWHVTKGIAHVSLWPVRAIMGTPDMPTTHKPKEGESVYDIADPMLDIASIIYYYTELRSETKVLLVKYAEKFNLTTKEIDIIRNAIMKTVTTLEAVKEVEQADVSTSNVLADYQVSLKQLEDIKSRFNLTGGDVDVFTTYFNILKEPKSAESIKSDLLLYNDFISPLFRKSFGGSEWNVSNIISMVDRDPTMYIKEIDDDFSKKSFAKFINGFESELVYAIFVSPANKRVTVAFRGSVNANDWKTNMYGFGVMTDFELPGYTSDESAARDARQSYGRVHQGFYEYLFGKTKKGANESYKSKSEEIMGILCDLFENECKGFSLFVTGHSLGGSLSTLFAARAATFGQFGKVTNVSFASPYCGGQEFRDHFYELEKKNLIRHIRISNEEDVVPLIPFFAPNGIAPPEMFKHVGMNIRMYDGDHLLMPKCRLFYPKEGSLPNEIRNAVLNNVPMGLSVGVISKHLCPEYCSRLESSSEELKKISVEGLYEDAEITGWSTDVVVKK